MKAFVSIAMALMGLLGVGCEPAATIEPVSVVTVAVPVKLTYDDLAVVLKAGVTRKGLLDVAALNGQAKALDRQLAQFAVTGPTVTPALFGGKSQQIRDETALAYWYNARAAWAMKLMLLAVGEDPDVEALSAAALERRPFWLNGRVMTLTDIDTLLMKDADWRTVVAAPGVLRQRAALPREPIAADGTRRTIAERFSKYVDSPGRLVIDTLKRQVLLPEVFWSVRDKPIRDYEVTYGATGATLVTSLLPVVTGSPHRRLQDAVGYTAARAARDGTLALVEKDN